MQHCILSIRSGDKVKWRFLLGISFSAGRGGFVPFLEKGTQKASLKSFDQIDSARNIFLHGQNV